MRLLLTLLRHRTTWRFLLVLAGALGGFTGYSAATQWTGDSRVLSTHL